MLLGEDYSPERYAIIEINTALTFLSIIAAGMSKPGVRVLLGSACFLTFVLWFIVAIINSMPP
jgi:hypothetical protein